MCTSVFIVKPANMAESTGFSLLNYSSKLLQSIKKQFEIIPILKIAIYRKRRNINGGM